MDFTKKLLTLLIAFMLVAALQAQDDLFPSSMLDFSDLEPEGTNGDGPTTEIIDETDLVPEEINSCAGRWTRWTQWTDCSGLCNGRGYKHRSRVCEPSQWCAAGETPLCRGMCEKYRKCRVRDQGNCGRQAGHDTTTTTSTTTTSPTTTDFQDRYKTTLPPRKLCIKEFHQGYWSAWGCWSHCDSNGMRTRYRTCTNPPPSGPGMYCKGRPQMTRRCPGFSTTTESTTTVTTTEASTATPCLAGRDVIFVLDSSGSIGNANFTNMTSEVNNLIRGLDLETKTNKGEDKIRVGVVVFSNTAQTANELDDPRIPAFYQYMASNTNTHLGIRKAIDMFRGTGNRPKNPDLLAVITDGQSTVPQETLRAAAEAKAARIRVIALGVGRNIVRKELEDIVTNSQTDVYEISEFAKLGSELQRLFTC